ncbi:MAG: YeeE/YedE family protein, partial [Myxococcales bacterium]|nr:YeeE/YedE family protein [Myxococcales bacterium]
MSAPSRRGRVAAAFGAGLLFGLGLVLAGMTIPAKVIGFLDITSAQGAWDPSLMFVMGGAIAVHAVALRLVRRRGAPLFDRTFHLPTRKDLDLLLLAGAAIFGVGWGLAGYCPGPGLVSAAGGMGAGATFVAAMLA